jgi:hypothetical protein
VVGIPAVKLEIGVMAVVVAGSVAELIVFGIPEEFDEPLVVKLEIRLNKSPTTLLTSFCSPDVPGVVVGATVVKPETGTTEVSGVTRVGAELALMGGTKELDELPVARAAHELNMSTALLVVVVGAAGVQLASGVEAVVTGVGTELALSALVELPPDSIACKSVSIDCRSVLN